MTQYSTTSGNVTVDRATHVSTKTDSPVDTEPPKKVFRKKKTIFRFYQMIWYVLYFIEFLLGFRFFLKALGANPFAGFTAFVYGITQPLTLPFQGLFPTPVSGRYVVEWSTLIAMVVYLLVAYALVEFFQFVKPVSQEEVEESVDEQ